MNETPPRIGYVLKRFPRLSETFVLHELLELERQGTMVRVYAMSETAERRHGALAELSVPVTYLPSNDGGLWRLRHGRYSDGRFVEQPWAAGVGKVSHEALALVQAAALAALAQTHGVSHLHAHFANDATTVALLAHRLTGIPFSFTAHAKDIYDEGVDQPSLTEKIRQARFVVTVSDFNRRRLAALVDGDAARKIARIYNGVDLDRFRPDAGVAREPDLVLAAGRLVEKKGFRYLVRACRLLEERRRPFRCVIVGEGPEKTLLQDEIKALGLAARVRLGGPLPQEELRELMRRAAVFVLPCVVTATGDRDALPTVLLEALALGLPAVSTDVSGVPEVIDHETTGLLVPPGDPTRLAQAIDSLLSDPDLRARFAAEGRRTAEERFDLRQAVSCLRALFAGDAGWLLREPAASRNVADEHRVSVL